MAARTQSERCMVVAIVDADFSIGIFAVVADEAAAGRRGRILWA